MNSQGGRDFIIGSGRQSPKIIHGVGKQSLFLADYNGTLEHADIVRLHPQNKQYDLTLIDIIGNCDRATGYETTALVTAALHGLKITCKGKNSILLQKNWLELLPYANWSYYDIEKGDLWQHLRSSLPQQVNPLPLTKQSPR